MRIAAIDIGTNSVHMIVVQVKPDLSFEVIDREKEMVRLGAGGLDGRALTDTAMTAGLQALAKFRRLADSYKVDEIVAGATSATREAENGGDFLAEVEAQTGIRARVITGDEEARLIHLAAGYGTDLGGRAGVVIDIGGGSVEITLGPATEVKLARSFKVGVIRLTERFVKSDPLDGRDERRLVKHIRTETGPYVARVARRRFAKVIGTSGTILSLGAVAAAQDGQSVASDLRNVRVSAKAIRRLRKRLLSLDQAGRLAVAGLDPRRADISVAGIVLIDTLLEQLGADELTLCDLALREGLVLDYIQRNRAHIAKVESVPDIRRRSVIELGERCNYSPVHARKVADLALSLFDQTRSVHRLGTREREWLEYAGLLHDIGMHIGYEAHHKHSYYLVKHGGLRGFEPEEVEAIALLARYHRRGAPKKSHDEFASLGARQRETVKTLSAFLTVAESLDRSHAQIVSAVKLTRRGDATVLRLDARSDAELEAWAVNRHLAPLSRFLGSPVRAELPTVKTSTRRGRPRNRTTPRPTGRRAGAAGRRRRGSVRR